MHYIDYIDRILYFVGLVIFFVSAGYSLFLVFSKKKSQKKADNPVQPVAATRAQEKHARKSEEKKVVKDDNRETGAKGIRYSGWAACFIIVTSLLIGVICHAIYHSMWVGIVIAVITGLLLICVSIQKVNINHRAIPRFLNTQLSSFEFTEGYVLWFPKPLGEIEEFNMQEEDPVMLSYVTQKQIAFADGTIAEETHLKVTYKRIPGQLYRFNTQIGKGREEKILMVNAEAAVRRAAIALSASFSDEIRQANLDMDCVAMRNSLVRWGEMILYGYYPPNGHHFSSEEKSRVEEKGLYLPEEEQSRISSFANVMKGYGLEIKDIKISSMKLPPMIQEAIDKKAIESVQGFQEIANAQTFAAINKIMEGTADDKNTQAILAALAQGLEGINLNVVTSTGNQGSSGIDGIVAALMNKNKGGES